MEVMTVLAAAGNVFDSANQVLIFIIYAGSLNLLLGYTGQISVAHAAFGALGGYAAGYLSATQGTPFLAALVIGVMVAMVMGAAVSLPALYLDVQYLILLTLGLSTVVIAVTGAIPELGGTFGLTGIQAPNILGHEFVTPQQYFPLLLILAVLAIAICLRLGNSAFGRVLRGIRDDELVTRSVGRNPFAYKVVVFTVTSGLAGLAGAMYAYYNGTAQPLGYDLSQSLLIIAMVVIGGTANMWGSILGATLLVLLEPFLDALLPLAPEKAALVRVGLYGALIVVILLVRPQGLVPEGRSPLNVLRRRGARDTAEPEPAAPPAPAKPQRDSAVGSVQVRGLTKSFGGIHAARDLDFELHPGQITGLIGPNGAGKTTVFNLLTGTLRPDAGTVTLHGQDITGWRADRVAREGMVRSFQDVRVYPRLTVLENVMLGVQVNAAEGLGALFVAPGRARRGERAARAEARRHLRFVGLADRAAEPAGSLAFGEQKLVALARILATGSDVLLLDEPASGIDAEWVDRMLDLIEQLRDEGRTICIVEHNLHVVERIANHIYFMEAGAITADGTMEQLVSQERLAEAYFGTT
jgi:branched-chain amino acid transport system permease protein